jgi:glutamate synthase domain-containing protein 3
VLGKTGKNFAAGMSGGYAFVLDEDGEFASKMCNKAIVDLDPLNNEDERLVQNLIKRHVDLTGSRRGERILNDWETVKMKFVKVFPHDYKRVLNAKQKILEETVTLKKNGSDKEAVNG